MSPFETVTLSRDCVALKIPSGEKTMLQKGHRIHITQSLGGSFTLMTEQGYMVQIAGDEADAIGKEKPAPIGSTGEVGKDVPLEQAVWDQLKTCFDPEIPVNIVDLGLVYECRMSPMPDDTGKKKVDIKMTLTAPGCGMGDVLRTDAMQKIQKLQGVGMVNVELVWEPQWDRSMMSEAAKLQLGMI